MIIRIIIGIISDKYPLRRAENLIPLPLFASLRNPSKPHPDFLVAKSTKISEPSGSRIFDTRKSSRSSMFVPSPSGWNPERTLKPRMHGRDRTVRAMKFTMHAFLLVQFLTSI